MSPLVLLSLHLLCHYLALHARASTLGTLALFLDEQCQQASIINPTVNVAADVCLVTNGALGVSVEILPPCSSGEATLQLYQDTSCANRVDNNLDYQNCYFDGPNGVPAMLFACTADTEGSKATATSTVSAGSSSMAIATGAAASPPSGSSAGTSPQNTPSSNEAATSTTPTSSTSPTNTASSGNTGSGGSGLSQNSQIALGVGLPVGSIVVALLAWLCPCGKSKTHHPPNRARRPFFRSLHQAGNQYQMYNSPQNFAPSSFNTPINTPQNAFPSW